MIPGTDIWQLTSAPGRLVGVYPALVTDVQDPDGQGRVQVSLPFVNEQEGPPAAAWARLATFMAGADRGSWFIPEVEDEVLVAFLAGDPRHPVVIGALWNGVDAPPERMDADNTLRSITSRSGHRLCFDDSRGGEKVTVETAGGHRLSLDDTPGGEKVSVETAGGHLLSLDDSGGGTVTLRHSIGASVEIDALGNVTIDATFNVTIKGTKVIVVAPLGVTSSTGMAVQPSLTVDALRVLFLGEVHCKSLVADDSVTAKSVKTGSVTADSVDSATYTGGGGPLP